jgi:hypothetical protein
LIPYFQYTVRAVIGTLLLALQYRHLGQQGFYGASISVEADSLVTPWLVVYWLAIVVRGFSRAHAVLGQFYNLSNVDSLADSSAPWPEVSCYFLAFGLIPNIAWMPLVLELCRRYSRATNRFLFGTASQHRSAICK